jgi:hypothetical protein
MRIPMPGSPLRAAAALVAVLGCSAPVARDASPPLAHPAASVAPAPCAPVPGVVGSFGAQESLALDKAAFRKKGLSPKLLAKLDASAFRYFRAINPESASKTCFAFKNQRWNLPVVAIHGDAHLEQFVVTRDSYGLEDFDQSGYGPAIVDLVRYATSLHLACREIAWPCRSDDAVNAYFKAYRAALDRLPVRRQPKVVERLRQKAPQETGAWLRWAESLMKPLPQGDDEAKRRAWAQFAARARAIDASRPPSFYDVVRLGTLEMGIGSAHETKVLLRIRGATDAPGDDLILEARSGSLGDGGACAWRPAHGGASQPLFFMAILGPRMPSVYGFVPLDEGPAAQEFWVQAWDPGYRELSIGDLENQAELEELAEDAASQLAGHFWTQFPEPLRLHQRHAQLRSFDLVEARARAFSRELADEVLAGWEAYRRSR